jgi:hypothetical protein
MLLGKGREEEIKREPVMMGGRLGIISARCPSGRWSLDSGLWGLLSRRCSRSAQNTIKVEALVLLLTLDSSSLPSSFSTAWKVLYKLFCESIYFPNAHTLAQSVPQLPTSLACLYYSAPLFEAGRPTLYLLYLLYKKPKVALPIRA